MGRESPADYRVTWTDDTLDLLLDRIQRTRHADGNPDWVVQKVTQCIAESVRRLELFPDLRFRYVVAGRKCGAMTLQTLPIQLFYRLVGEDEITVFACRWASLDKTGPQRY